jgi:(1->4)-alpha-D-glucan 1-alpha-D-glucosylmutase
MSAPPSTYRLQIRPSFGLGAAAQLCEYLRELGAGAVYLSPILASASGSDHGYDVVDFSRVDDARGGAAGWRALVDAAHGLQLVLDVVPNHTGIADAAENEPWWDVLRLGSDSPYARWFDIDWARGRVLLPVLGDDFNAARDLSVVGDELRYGSHRFPIAPGTAGGSGAQVHERQHYELVSFRTEQSYRRFFAVPTLAGLRVDDPAVFDATHREVLRLVDDGVTGLRIDHPDGLADPLGYLSRLRAAVPDVWLTVEKILEPGESLPRSWPVAGTTGYDALAEVNALFVDPSAEAALSDLYRSLTGDQLSFDQHVEAGKRLVATTILRPEVRRLAALCAGIEQAAEAITELLVAFPVYRSYLPEGASHLTAAVETVARRRPALAEAIAALYPRLADPADELCVRFQQTSGAVMAKGVEDTAYYRYTRFVALNEVGGDPSRFGSGLDGFHAAAAQRQLVAPHGMTTLSTHDTKRGEDVRARLAVLAEVLAEWTALVGDLMARAPVPNAALGYLLWQTFAGTGFIGRDRMHAYAEKAMREAADGTGWIDPDHPFEAAVHAVVDAAYDLPEIRDPLAAFIERITPFGWSNSLSQKVVALTMPGIPDVYQGTELWEDSLVDPDNRRPVDFTARTTVLARLGAPPPIDETGAAKLWLVSRALRLRRDRPDLFTGYAPIRALGPASDHVVAFDRGGAVTVAARLPVRLARDGGWRDTTLALAAAHTDVLTGRSWSGAVRVADLLDVLPVALLVR